MPEYKYELKELVLKIRQRTDLINIIKAALLFLFGLFIMYFFYSIQGSLNAIFIIFGLIPIFIGVCVILEKQIFIDNIQKIIIINWGIIIPFFKKIYQLSDFDEVDIKSERNVVIKEISNPDLRVLITSYTIVLKSKIRNIKLTLFCTDDQDEAKEIEKIVDGFVKNTY